MKHLQAETAAELDALLAVNPGQGVQGGAGVMVAQKAWWKSGALSAELWGRVLFTRGDITTGGPVTANVARPASAVQSLASLTGDPAPARIAATYPSPHQRSRCNADP